MLSDAAKPIFARYAAARSGLKYEGVLPTVDVRYD